MAGTPARDEGSGNRRIEEGRRSDFDNIPAGTASGRPSGPRGDAIQWSRIGFNDDLGRIGAGVDRIRKLGIPVA
jgi:hypothetical protein